MEYQSGAVGPIDSVQRGWDLIKNNYWTFFGMTLTAFVVLIVVGMVMNFITQAIVGIFAGIMGFATQNASDAAKIGGSLMPQILALIIGIFTNLVTVTISGVFYVGFFTGCSKQARGEFAEFGDLFAGFQKVTECLIVAVVLSLIGFVIGVIILVAAAAFGLSAFGVGMLMQNGEFNPAVFGGLFFAIIVLAIVAILINLIYSSLTSFIYPLIAERNASGMESVLTSVKAGLANLVGMVLLMVVLFFMLLGGAFACLVGILFVAPIAGAAIYGAYQSVFGTFTNQFRQEPPPPPSFGFQQG
jgi:uncharacterized membrane protein